MIEKKYSNYLIAKLITKSVLEDLNTEENTQLNDWLKQKGNKELYNRIVNVENLQTKQEFLSALNSQDAYNNVQLKIALKKRKRMRRLLQRTIGAAAVLCLFVTAGIKWHNYIQTQQQIISQQTLKEIKPGYEKATLILANGVEINLEASINKQIQLSGAAEINNLNNLLKYRPTADTNAGEIAYNTLYVPTGGIYTVELSDGTKVWLNSNSSIKYPEVFTGSQRVVELTGEAYFDVTKSDKQFVVKTEHQDVTVLGTEFNVSAYTDDVYFSTTLVEGKVKLSSNQNTDVILTPGERGYLQVIGNNTLKVNTVNTRNYTLWKDGRFYFEQEPLENILKKMARWYGTDVKFEDESIKKTRFTGVVSKDKPITYLLDIISKTSRISYMASKNNSGRYEITISKIKQ
ncbi:FecR family protein [Gaetbulibacter saemankumensis]|uniref:FecR family protein n=1 Tax=Gaetbulibacter saemankumensis TaxID=311208 RepID=UPI00041EC88F|nr:FecR family protein [Gaetbulibacter saemankumensis]